MSSIGISSSPSPAQMHSHLFRKSRQNLSITTMSAPFAQWQPLRTHQNMETRSCHHTGSRIHTLSCGHTISVTRDAEPCATNCASISNITSPSWAKTPVQKTHVAVLEKTRLAIDAALKIHSSFLTDVGFTQKDSNFTVASHISIILTIFNNQESRLRPPVDLISGDFSCELCSTPGLRAASPAFILNVAPYNCVVVKKDDNDLAAIKELVKGVMPMAPVKRERERDMVAGVRGRGGKKVMSAETRARVREGRVTKRRVEEKRRVLGMLKDEVFVEELEGLGL
ncbi:hypothetical protein P280DRAFT_481307 [Massarina eburnea CBS 473.64]|uniref:Uncharacterized protein n=1 Tax=Massarina eburnea CBS 473.64 TaxID=1395130 RepID=A0A6A6RUZ3_9PLEO|nr:hypothetical protein P280DRAFT_481307 [Massarina eburnea CBS 473.64]